MQPGSSGTSATKAESSSLQKMMISYRFSISVFPKIVPQDDDSNLLHLVGLRLGSVPLEVDQFLDSGLDEHMVAPGDSLREGKCKEERAQIVKPDISVTSATQNLFESLVVFAQIGPFSARRPSTGGSV